MATEVIEVRDEGRIAQAAREGARVVEGGGLVAFATETVYGIAASAARPAAIERLRDLKDRPSNPFTVHLGEPGDATQYVDPLPDGPGRLIRRAWPGPLTLLVPVEGAAGRRLAGETMRGRLCLEGRVGLRCPDEPVARAMLSAVGAPVVAPSANLKGMPSPRSARDVLESLDGRIDLLIDSGPTRLGTDSTIVRFSSDGSWEVVRRGTLDERMIANLLVKRIVFVCTGNTCRSPMAEGIARRLLSEREGCSPDELADRGLEVLSAGTSAPGGAPATAEAVAAAAERGARIDGHRSRPLSPDLLRHADVILCMTRSHLRQVREALACVAGCVSLLDEEGEIPDPIGAGLDVYRQTACAIERSIRRRMDEGTL
jgi:protein-tyrosine phosphatase